MNRINYQSNISRTPINNISSQIMSIIVHSSITTLFHPYSFVALLQSQYKVRLIMNVVFLATEIGCIITNLYFLLRIMAFLRSMQLIKSHYRAIVFYNQYTHLCIGLCLHLSLTGLLTSCLIFSSHLYLSYYILKNEHKKTNKKIDDSILSCHYIPFIRDAFCNVCIYLMLLIMVIYRRADIKSISQKIHSSNKRNSQILGDEDSARYHMLLQRRQKARLVLLHSLPWVLGLGLAIPRGLLDMRYDFRQANIYKKLESPLAEELCIQQSKDNDLVNLTMWTLQSWMPLILSSALCITYSVKDNLKRHQHQRRLQQRLRGKSNANNRKMGSRINSATTLGGVKTNDKSDNNNNNNNNNNNKNNGNTTKTKNMYSSSRTLYSLHNYKDEVIKLVKSSPIIFYLILAITLILKLPYNSIVVLDYCYYLLKSRFLVERIILMCLKLGDYWYLALLPLIVLQAVILLFRNSLKILEIRGKVKKLAETDDSLLRSTLNISRSYITLTGVGGTIGRTGGQQGLLYCGSNDDDDDIISRYSHNTATLRSNRDSAFAHHNSRRIVNNINYNNNLENNNNNNRDDEDEDDYDDSEKPFMLSTV